MRNIFLIILSLFLLTNCQTSNNNSPKENQSDKVLIFNDTKDTSTIKFNQAIMELPEFESWEYNWDGSSTKIIGTSHFEKRKIIIDNKPFYHIELLRQKVGKVTDSFINPEEIVCYFRIDPTDNKIKILDLDTKIFLDLMSENGRQYFKSCLKNRL